MVDLSEINSKRSLVKQIADLHNQAETWRIAATAADGKARIVLLEVVVHLHNAAQLLRVIKSDLEPARADADAAAQ